MSLFFNFLNKKLTIKVPIWVLALFILLPYALWELHWYRVIGLAFVKWHTHLMLYAYLLLAGMCLFQIAFDTRFREQAKNLFLAFISVVTVFLFLEIALLIAGSEQTYSERNRMGYRSMYTTRLKSHYLLWPAGKPRWLTEPEFSYWRPTNSLGFSDYEWALRKKPNEKRIIVLGDSFVEGQGAPYDSTLPAFLKKRLTEAGDSFTVMNAGICSSDPFYNYVGLKDLLLPYKPDVVIQLIGSNDIQPDILLRGGMERFSKDGMIKYTPSPWWEPLYAVSLTTRLAVRKLGYDQTLRRAELSPETERQVNDKVIDLFKQYADLCRANGTLLMVVLFPGKKELDENRYAFDFSKIVSSIQQESNVRVFNLMPDYRNYLANNNSNTHEYFWKKDRHNNSKGYEMMAESVFEHLIPLVRNTNEENEKNNHE
ncbi:MAG: GDSL-type esterase/lipase family protein [Bacteroidota bacterium]